jgi:hypothetical protein
MSRWGGRHYGADCPAKERRPRSRACDPADRPRSAHARATVVGRFVEQRQVVAGPNHRSGVAGERDDRAGTEDGVDGAETRRVVLAQLLEVAVEIEELALAGYVLEAPVEADGLRMAAEAGTCDLEP